MNKTYIGVGVAIIVLVIIAFLLVGKKNSEAPVVSNETATQSTQQEATQPQKSSAKELIASGKPQQCTFTDAESKTSGTVFVANNKMRGDFVSTVNGKAMNSHIVIEGNTMYTWVDGMNTGFQMSLDASAQAGSQNQGMDVNEKVDYKCSSWSEDSSKFNRPTSVTFTSFSQMMIPGGAR